MSISDASDTDHSDLHENISDDLSRLDVKYVNLKARVADSENRLQALEQQVTINTNRAIAELQSQLAVSNDELAKQRVSEERTIAFMARELREQQHALNVARAQAAQYHTFFRQADDRRDSVQRQRDKAQLVVTLQAKVIQDLQQQVDDVRQA